jgi:hypothetical protein
MDKQRYDARQKLVNQDNEIIRKATKSLREQRIERIEQERKKKADLIKDA